MNPTLKTNSLISETKTSLRLTISALVLLISFFSHPLLAGKKGARLVEFEKRKSSHKAVARFSAPAVSKKAEPGKPQITNIERIYEGKEYIVKIRARKFKQGELMFVRLQANIPGSLGADVNHLKKYNLFWMKKKIEMFVLGSEYMGFIPIHPELAPGTYDLEIKTDEQAETYKVCPVQIEENKFKETRVTENLKLPKRFAPKKYTKGSIKFILECEKLKRAAFQSETMPFFTQNFHLPAKIKKITSNFYARRNYFTKKGKPHGGIDIRGSSGDPIHAIQDGKVVISRPMYFEGIFTVIDHGSKIFSLYMHQSETLVHEGEIVKRGQLIGKIGSTGMSTGPHLHLGLKVDNVLVNPMSVIHLKIF